MITLSQKARAGLEFMGNLQRYSSTELHAQAKADFYANPDMAALGDKPIGDRPVEKIDELVAKAEDIAAASPAHRFNRFYQRVVAEEIYNRGIPAAEEKRGDIEKTAAPPIDPSKAGTLTLNPDVAIPDYYDGVEWHLMPGGWDGFDLTMPMFMAGVSPYIFSHGGYAAVDVDADIRAQRLQVVNELPRSDYKRIYECGCGGSVTLAVLRQRFPDAELAGSDLSAQLLKGGHQVANALGLNIHLKQEDSRRTSEPDDHYDAAISYAVFHEMDDAATFETLKEMFRILAPGGDMIISDPGPFRAITPYQAVIYSWETDHREEPYFTASIRRSLPDMMRRIGYEDVKEYGIGPGNYPWITYGRKPS